MFSFNFNLIATHKGKKASYALNKTCTLSLQWSHREVTCEMNYMEVNFDFFFFLNVVSNFLRLFLKIEDKMNTELINIHESIFAYP